MAEAVTQAVAEGVQLAKERTRSAQGSLTATPHHPRCRTWSMPFETTWASLPSVMSRCRLRNQAGILNWAGFCMMVTMRSSSSELSSPALRSERQGRGGVQ